MMSSSLLRLLVVAVWLSVSSSAAPPYDESVAKIANIHSAISYAPYINIKGWTRFKSDLCSSMTEDFDVDNIFLDMESQSLAYVGTDSGHKLIILAVRGWVSVQNWASVVKTRMKYSEECIVEGTSLGNVHQGFCAHYQTMTPLDIIARVKALADEHPDYQVLVTGHSTGSSVASLAATHMGLVHPTINPLVYTFGEPRTGDISFVDKHNEAGCTSYRVVHKTDPVAHLGFCCRRCAAKSSCPYHKGTQIYYNREMYDLNSSEAVSYTTCAPNEDPDCRSMPFPFRVTDHFNYFNANTGDLC